MDARLVLLALFTWPCVFGARILAVLPTNTRSHYAMYGRLLDALARRNHQLTIISHFPMKNQLANVELISLAGTIPDITNNLTRTAQTFKPSFIHNIEQITKECVQACEVVSQSKAVKTLLNSTKKFDLVILEVFGTDCFVPFGKRFEAPVIGLLSSVPLPWVNEQIGNPQDTTYVPSYMVGYGQSMNVWERFCNTVAVLCANWIYGSQSVKPSQEIAVKMFGPDTDLVSLTKKFSLVLSNSHFSINEVRPLVPAFIEVGGLHIDDSQTLTVELKTLLDSSTEGVVYWSFGSMSRIETIPGGTLKNIFKVISEFPHTFLIKMNRNNLSSNLTVPDNVVTMDWIPQYKTLCHPNVILFISHGGLLGTQEAVACAVPMLTVPLYADQALNARAMTDRGVARTIHLGYINEMTWRKALVGLISNPRYKANALQLRKVFQDRPMSPLDTGVYWVEYVLRHKGALHLRSPGLDLSTYEKLFLDIIAISLIITVITTFILYNLFRYLCTRCIKWWPQERMLFEKGIIRSNRLVLCMLGRNKNKIN